jgi:hypothetical protein
MFVLFVALIVDPDEELVRLEQRWQLLTRRRVVVAVEKREITATRGNETVDMFSLPRGSAGESID